MSARTKALVGAGLVFAGCWLFGQAVGDLLGPEPPPDAGQWAALAPDEVAPSDGAAEVVSDALPG